MKDLAKPSCSFAQKGLILNPTVEVPGQEKLVEDKKPEFSYFFPI